MRWHNNMHGLVICSQMLDTIGPAHLIQLTSMAIAGICDEQSIGKMLEISKVIYIFGWMQG